MKDLELKDLMAPQEKKTLEAAAFNALSDITSAAKSDVLSDISDTEIKLLTRLEMIGKIKNVKIYGEVVNTFLRLRMSKNRASRKEILEGIKNAHQPTDDGKALNDLRRVLQ